MPALAQSGGPPRVEGGAVGPKEFGVTGRVTAVGGGIIPLKRAVGTRDTGWKGKPHLIGPGATTLL